MTAAIWCRSCGIEPLEDARFCHGGGSAVAEAETHAEAHAEVGRGGDMTLSSSSLRLRMIR